MIDLAHRHPVWAMLAVLLAVAAAAWSGSQFEPGSWYAQLNKPPLNPPNWTFGVVWPVLYLMMAVAAWLIWRAKDGSRGVALVLFLVHLIMQAAWSWVFFGLQAPAPALLTLALLWLMVAVLTAWFLRIHRTAGLLLVPYLLWLTFAGYLNLGIILSNPGV